MTPRRLDLDSVVAKLELMVEALDILRGVGGPTADDLRSDGVLRGAHVQAVADFLRQREDHPEA